jgi:guanylate kinase
MDIICIAGYSGGGKTTAARLMQRHLPNAYDIRSYQGLFQIKNPKELENVYGMPVETDDERQYFIKLSKTYPNDEEKFLELIYPYVEKNYRAAMIDVEKTLNPDYVILEWITLPQFSFWNEALCRIIVRPTDWEKLFEHIAVRHGQESDRKSTEERRLVVKDTIENAPDVTHWIMNNYDEKFEQDIIAICAELASAKR